MGWLRVIFFWGVLYGFFTCFFFLNMVFYMVFYMFLYGFYRFLGLVWDGLG